jgi:hypothetical protein
LIDHRAVFPGYRYRWSRDGEQRNQDYTRRVEEAAEALQITQKLLEKTATEQRRRWRNLFTSGPKRGVRRSDAEKRGTVYDAGIGKG